MAFPEQSIKLPSTAGFEYARSVSEVLLNSAVVDIPYAATLVLPPLEFRDTVFVVAALTGNTIVPAISGSRKGQRVTFLFTQDGTGGRTITWNAVFAAAANSGSTANHKAACSFVFDGARWVQEAALTFKA